MKRYTFDPRGLGEEADGRWVKYDDAKAAIEEAVQAAISAAAVRVEAINAGMLSCDAGGNPVDAYIPRWRAIRALENP